MVERISFEDEISKNKIKSFLLIIVVFIVIIALGMLISLAIDPSLFFVFTIFATIISVLYVLIGYYRSKDIALSSVRAQPAPKSEKMLYGAVEDMSIASGLPMPMVYIMESDQINAFATGRDPKHAAICVTTGALKKLDKDELEGVIAHEMSHIANYDVRFMTLAAILVGMTSIFAQLFLRSLFLGGGGNRKGGGNIIFLLLAVVAAIIAPFAAQLVQLAISRRREFGADATGVRFTRYPAGLRDALEKIKKDSVPPEDSKRYNKAVAPLFISDPFKKKVQNLFSTHPDLDSRIKILNAM